MRILPAAKISAASLPSLSARVTLPDRTSARFAWPFTFTRRTASGARKCNRRSSFSHRSPLSISNQPRRRQSGKWGAGFHFSISKNPEPIAQRNRIRPKVSRIRPNVLWIHPKVLRILPKVLQFRPKMFLIYLFI